jgi:glucokinase
MPKACVGVDVGGTFTKLAAVSPAGKVLAEAEIPSEVEAGPEAFVDRVRSLLQTWRAKKNLSPAALGLGLAGDVDSRAGALRFAPNLKGWDGFSFKKAFSKSLKIPVAVDNDANAAVWGGYKTELKGKPRHVVGVTLGTGVGGGLVIDGRLHRGVTGSAGELGHVKIVEGGEPCHCGDRGCLEAYAGSYGILRAARQRLAASPSKGSVLRGLCPDLEELTPRLLTQAADSGCELSREVWNATAEKLATGLEGLVLVVNPDAILILGGVSRAGKWLLDPIKRRFDAQPFRTAFSSVKVTLADNQHAGRVGAALLALEELKTRP